MQNLLMSVGALVLIPIFLGHTLTSVWLHCVLLSGLVFREVSKLERRTGKTVAVSGVLKDLAAV